MITATELTTAENLALRLKLKWLREFQLVSLLFGRVCGVRQAKWFTFIEN